MNSSITNRTSNSRSLFLAALALAVALCFSGCSGGSGFLRQSGEGHISPKGGSEIERALGELSAMNAPEGVDAELFEKLKEELARQLRVAASGKATATAPAGAANRVINLELQDTGTAKVLAWNYLNLGDYDQNGVVGVADITPIAIHYSEEYLPEDTESLAAVIDGSGNRKVDVSDITPIAMNFGSRCAGYKIAATASPGNWSEIGVIPFEQAQGENMRLAFSYELPLVEGLYYRVAPIDASGNEGIRSVAVPEGGNLPPIILETRPSAGLAGEQGVFTAEVESAAGCTYSWSFGGGATPATSNEVSPQVTFGLANVYNGLLTVTSEYGQDSFYFRYTITGEIEYTVSGIVQAAGGGGLEGVKVTLAPGGFSATTNAAGAFAIEDVPNGSYTLSLEKEGYVFIPPGGSITVQDADIAGLAFSAMGRTNTWHIVSVESDYDVGWCASMAIVNGYPAISYYIGPPYYDLKYAIAADARGAAWMPPRTVDAPGLAGWNTSLAVIGGRPAIAYYYAGNGEMTDSTSLRFVRANDGYGGTWGNPVNVDLDIIVEYYAVSLCEVNGKPAIAYHDEHTKTLKYTQANDVAGNSWKEPQTLDGEFTGGYARLAIVNGRPAIAHVDTYNSVLYFVRANDADGNSWGSRVRVSKANEGVAWVSLAVVAGKPAVAYYASYPVVGYGHKRGLFYAWATDSDGTSWGESAIIDGNGEDIGGWCSLATVGGNPAIAYFDNTDGAEGLRYIRAQDAQGSGWGVSTMMDTSRTVGCWNITLADIGGEPVISYYVDTDLRYAWYY